MANLHQYPVSGVWPSRVAGIAPVVALVVTTAACRKTGIACRNRSREGIQK